MPHLIIEHSDNLPCHTAALMEAVYNAAVHSAIMSASDIKIRALPYTSFRLHLQQQQFVHVSCRILAGRTHKQRVLLSEAIRNALSLLLADVYSISVEVIDMEPVSYKKRLLDK